MKTVSNLQHWFTEILACQVCTFEQALKFKAWKLEQTSLFYYNKWQAADVAGITIGMQCSEGIAFVMPDDLQICTESSVHELSAYTVAEMMAMIGFQSTSNVYGRREQANEKNWYRIDFNLNTAHPFTKHLTKPLAEALGDLLLFRLDNKSLTFEKENENLLEFVQNNEAEMALIL